MVDSSISPEDVLRFWLEEVGPKGWYQPGEGLDEDILARFGRLWRHARDHGWMGWTPMPRSALALVIVLDQFPRNMFRGTADAFATDRQARARAKCAIEKGWDMRVAEPERQFFYMPLCHSESLADQERAVRLIAARLPNGPDTLLHARAHRAVIRAHGRFPHRNADLGRANTPAERDFLEAGGYGAVVRNLQNAGVAAAS